MTVLEIMVMILAGLGVLAFLGAVIGMLTEDRGYPPMSPNEEYQWLTQDIGLTHEEAEGIMRPIGKVSGQT